MLRTNYFAPTLREVPAEATATSHKLMLRAGLVKMLAAGIYSYLPLGWAAVRKASEIIRQEMNRIGGQEILLPALTPADIWKETGRSEDFGEIMLRFKDRRGTENCLAPTHEEIICSVARGFIRSWRDLPQIWYQMQTKFRDEPRPRGGLLRLRQFIMKDAYSLDRDEEGLDKSYEAHREAYERIFQRCGLDYFIVGASSGVMGGAKSQEFMVESDAGEDEVARCQKCSYAANVEVASSKSPPVSEGEASTLKEVSTPTQKTVEEVSAFLKVPASRMVKTLIYMTGTGPVMALIAGDDDLSEDKLNAVAGCPARPALPEEVLNYLKAEVGFLGPHGAHGIPVFADLRLKDAKGMATGANKNGYHVTGLDLNRDVKSVKYVDLRTVKSGEGCPSCGEKMQIAKAIEIGHIFKLGVKYSEAMHATFLDENGSEKPIIMGSYGIGVERILAAAIENHADKDGIRWNSALAPLDVIVIPLGDDDEVLSTADEVYRTLRQANKSTLLDNREARPGVKMKDADLLGIPAHVVVSARNLKNNQIEIKNRFTGDRLYVSKNDVLKTIDEIHHNLTPEAKL